MQNNYRFILVTAAAMMLASLPSFAQPVTQTEAQAALRAYNAHDFADAAARFENIIRRQPTATYCYYAALASLSSHKELRGRQLLQYVITNFPSSPEAALAKKALPSAPADDAAKGATGNATAASAPKDPDDLPDSVKALLPADMKKLLDTPGGKAAAKAFVKDHADQLATIRKAETAGVLSKEKLSQTAEAQGLLVAHPERKFGDYVFTAQDIAKTGAHGIDQFRYPNCWFEASMAALAELPRGQRLIASMIRSRGSDTYVVKFPGDGVEYLITPTDLQKNKIHDRALWASLIECAQIKKFPENAGAEGSYGDQSRLEVGLGCITGAKAEILYTSNSNEQEISSFIGGAVKSQNPVVCSTYASGVPFILVPLHAYTIIGFDPTKNMITLRNPWGKQAIPFKIKDQQSKNQYEILDDGVIKVSIPLFQKSFYWIARSFI